MQQDHSRAGPIRREPDPRAVVFDVALMIGSGSGSCAVRFKSSEVVIVNIHFDLHSLGRTAGGMLPSMTLSARNQLKGTVEEIQLGGVMAHVVVRVGENLIESVITRRSAEEMALKQGDAVTVVIKSTEVMLQKD